MVARRELTTIPAWNKSYSAPSCSSSRRPMVSLLHRRRSPAMARMSAALAAVRVMEREGVTCAFGVPGAAINPLYAGLRARQTIRHILARHVEGAAHMAEGYTRARAGNIGV